MGGAVRGRRKAERNGESGREREEDRGQSEEQATSKQEGKGKAEGRVRSHSYLRMHVPLERTRASMRRAARASRYQTTSDSQGRPREST